MRGVDGCRQAYHNTASSRPVVLKRRRRRASMAIPFSRKYCQGKTCRGGAFHSPLEHKLGLRWGLKEHKDNCVTQMKRFAGGGRAGGGPGRGRGGRRGPGGS